MLFYCNDLSLIPSYVHVSQFARFVWVVPTAVPEKQFWNNLLKLLRRSRLILDERTDQLLASNACLKNYSFNKAGKSYILGLSWTIFLHTLCPSSALYTRCMAIIYLKRAETGLILFPSLQLVAPPAHLNHFFYRSHTTRSECTHPLSVKSSLSRVF